MDKLTSLNLSFDRILIQIIIPGLISIFPWFLLYLHFHPLAKDYFYSNQSVTITGISFLSLVAGMFLENLGGRFEVAYLDKKLSKKYDDFDEVWSDFLKLKFNDSEPIGLRYIRNILLRMKFEISAGIALIPMSVGLLFLNNYSNIFESCFYKYLFLIIFPLLICYYLLFVEASSSAKILAYTRKLLVEDYKIAKNI